MSRYVQKDYDNKERLAKKSMVSGIYSIVAPYLGVVILRILAAAVDLSDIFVLTALFCLVAVRVVLAIFALVYYGQWKTEDGFGNKYAKVGKVCGIIGLVLSIIPLMLFIVGFILIPIFLPNAFYLPG